MTVGVDRDLDRTVTHLLFHVGERGAVLDQQTTEGVSEVNQRLPNLNAGSSPLRSMRLTFSRLHLKSSATSAMSNSFVSRSH
jgi:hypothetical protein